MNILKQSDQLLIEQARERHPEAENDIEAVDLTAQDVYKTIQQWYNEHSTETELNASIELYGRLNFIRMELNNQQINKLSSFEVKGQ